MNGNTHTNSKQYKNVSSAWKIREKRKPGGETGSENGSQNHVRVRKIVQTTDFQHINIKS